MSSALHQVIFLVELRRILDDYDKGLTTVEEAFQEALLLFMEVM